MRSGRNVVSDGTVDQDLRGTIRITSKANELFRDMLKGASGKGRFGGLLFLEGYRLCETALEAGCLPVALAFSPELINASHSGRMKALFDNVVATSHPVEALDGASHKPIICSFPPTLFERLASTERPQGVALFVEPPARPPLDELRLRRGVLVAEDVQDPGNIGVLIRTADAFGLDAFICTMGGADPWQGKVLRSTVGSSFHLPIYRLKDIGQVATALGNRGAAKDGVDDEADDRPPVFVAALLDGRPLPEVSAELKGGPIPVLMVGNEGNGLSGRARELADIPCTIPMAGNTESLNVGVAAGICCYALFG